MTSARHGKHAGENGTSFDGCCQSSTAPTPVEATEAQHQRRANSLVAAGADGNALNDPYAASRPSPPTALRPHSDSPHTSSPRLPRLRSSRNASSPNAAGPPSQQPASSRPNQNLRPPSPVLRSPKNVSLQHPPPWTRAQLEREREAFFDTRVTGRAQIWNALKLICELLRASDVASAQGIMDAVLLTCPSGRIAKGYSRHGGAGASAGGSAERIKGGVYDEKGELYDIPDWVVADPADIIETDPERVEADSADDGEHIEEKLSSDEAAHNHDDDDSGDDEEGKRILSSSTPRRKHSSPSTTSAAARRRRASAEKGKGRASDLGELLSLRVRLSDRGSDLEVRVHAQQNVAAITREVKEVVGSRRVRLVYLGRVLDEKKTLLAQGWAKGHVISAMISGTGE